MSLTITQNFKGKRDRCQMNETACISKHTVYSTKASNTSRESVVGNFTLFPGTMGPRPRAINSHFPGKGTREPFPCTLRQKINSFDESVDTALLLQDVRDLTTA
jgi:hypothetical protein